MKPQQLSKWLNPLLIHTSWETLETQAKQKSKWFRQQPYLHFATYEPQPLTFCPKMHARHFQILGQELIEGCIKAHPQAGDQPLWLPYFLGLSSHATWQCESAAFPAPSSLCFVAFSAIGYTLNLSGFKEQRQYNKLPEHIQPVCCKQPADTPTLARLGE